MAGFETLLQLQVTAYLGSCQAVLEAVPGRAQGAAAKAGVAAGLAALLGARQDAVEGSSDMAAPILLTAAHVEHAQLCLQVTLAAAGV